MLGGTHMKGRDKSVIQTGAILAQQLAKRAKESQVVQKVIATMFHY
jgi:hypothetical protein